MTGTRGQTYCKIADRRWLALRGRAMVRVDVRPRPTADCRYQVAGLEGGSWRRWMSAPDTEVSVWREGDGEGRNTATTA